jgi:hypothetical protein
MENRTMMLVVGAAVALVGLGLVLSMGKVSLKSQEYLYFFSFLFSPVIAEVVVPRDHTAPTTDLTNLVHFHRKKWRKPVWRMRSKI